MCVKRILVGWKLTRNANVQRWVKVKRTGHPPKLPVSCPNLLDGHRLGEVPGLVDVAAPEHGHVIAEQLHGDDREDGLQRVHRLGHLMTK